MPKSPVSICFRDRKMTTQRSNTKRISTSTYKIVVKCYKLPASRVPLTPKNQVNADAPVASVLLNVAFYGVQQHTGLDRVNFGPRGGPAEPDVSFTGCADPLRQFSKRLALRPSTWTHVVPLLMKPGAGLLPLKSSDVIAMSPLGLWRSTISQLRFSSVQCA